MLEKLAFTCNAVLPLIILILVGYFLKRIKLLPDTFWKQANKLVFRVCLPVLLFFNIYKVESIAAIGAEWKVLLFVIVSILIVFGLGLLITMLLIKDPKQRGVILQCIFRSNYAIIGISLVELLANGDSKAVALAAVISAISIPLFNILAVISLSIFVPNENPEEEKKNKFVDVLLKICKNPLIIGVFAGIIVLCIRQLIPMKDNSYVFTIQKNIPFLYKSLNWISQIASPLALIALGGDFTFSAIGRLKKQIIIGVTLRVLIVPAICLVFAYILKLNPLVFPAFIALYGTPVAVSSVPMSIEMNNDGELAGQLVVWTSIASAFSLFLIIMVCASVGIF